MDHIAHIKNTGGLDNESVTEETVSEHCKKTALLARSYSAPFNIRVKMKSLMNLRTMSCAAGIGINRLFALLWCSSLIHYSRPGPKL